MTVASRAASVVAIFCVASMSTAIADKSLFKFEPSPPPTNGGAVSVLSASTAWVGLVRTEDGGASWQLARLVEGDIAFPFDKPSASDETVFVTTERGWLRAVSSTWQTEDGGANWLKLPGGELSSYAFKNGFGWMGRDDAEGMRMYKTTDNGRSWSRCESAPGTWEPYGAGQFVSSGNFFALVTRRLDERTSEYGVARSTDGGCSWSLVWTPHPLERLSGLFFLDAIHGWVAAYGGLFFRTEDGGRTWAMSKCPAHAGLCGEFFFVTPTHGYLSKGPDPPKAITGIMETMNGTDWSSVSLADLGKLPSDWQYGRYMQMLFRRR